MKGDNYVMTKHDFSSAQNSQLAVAVVQKSLNEVKNILDSGGASTFCICKMYVLNI